jgi:hypothetical protein
MADWHRAGRMTFTVPRSIDLFFALIQRRPRQEMPIFFRENKIEKASFPEELTPVARTVPKGTKVLLSNFLQKKLLLLIK